MSQSNPVPVQPEVESLIGSLRPQLPDYFVQAMKELGQEEAGLDASADLGLGEEDTGVELESEVEDALGEDVVLDIALVAASLGKEFDGAAFAQALQSGSPIEDVRLIIALGVLGTNKRVTAELVLNVMSELGFQSEVEAARVGKVALEESDVPVISMTPVPVVTTDPSGAGAAAAVALSSDADVSVEEPPIFEPSSFDGADSEAES